VLIVSTGAATATPIVVWHDRTYSAWVRDPLERPEDAIRRVYAYVAYRIGPGPDAEDVTSATIERAIRYRASYRRAEGSPGAWLIGIAKRCLADDAIARSWEIPSDVELEREDVPDDAAMRLDLGRAVAALDDRPRELVALRYGADLSSREIGRILEMSPGAVDVALHRALKDLRADLETPATARDASTERASRPA